MIYSIEKNILQSVKEKKVLEKDVQNLIGENLQNLLQLVFVEFEFSVEKKRIDILAFDEEKNAPVIIELKRENAEGLFDQGMEYFNLLSDRKSDFLLKLHEKLKIPADIKKVNWENSRVIFIGKNFTQRQKRAIDFQGLPIEIWEYEWYENNYFYLEQITLKKTAKLEIDIQRNEADISAIQKVKTEFTEYDRERHENYCPEYLWEIFERIESELLSWDNVSEKFNKHHISFKRNESSFCYFNFGKKEITITFGNKKRKNIQSSIISIIDVSSIGKLGTGDYRIKISDDENILEIFSLLRQSYNSFSS